MMHFEEIFVGFTILGILALMTEFDLQIRFAVHINIVVVCERREFFFFLRHLLFKVYHSLIFATSSKKVW